jgi:hypothetical protein
VIIDFGFSVQQDKIETSLSIAELEDGEGELEREG